MDELPDLEGALRWAEKMNYSGAKRLAKEIEALRTQLATERKRGCRKCGRKYTPETFDLGVCCICFRDISYERVYGKSWKEKLPSPTPPPDSKDVEVVWREAAKIARAHGAEHDAQAKKLEAGPESMWASKSAQLGVVANLAHIAMECECLASVFEGKADELRKGGNP